VPESGSKKKQFAQAGDLGKLFKSKMNALRRALLHLCATDDIISEKVSPQNSATDISRIMAFSLIGTGKDNSFPGFSNRFVDLVFMFRLVIHDKENLLHREA
jgi:hypothetical protein